MVQVRCPECGYLQSLSEERFLSISEDFLNCPHCNARVPKQWGPCNSDHMPEEARHKMSAFASRILNGGLIAKEVAHALESLVRRYGPCESSYKALGVGYTKLGDFKKAEEFLIKACEQDGSDTDIEKHLLETMIGLERFEDARTTGFHLVGLGEASSDDVARTAFALFNLEEIEEANDLLRLYPIIDTTSPAARQLKRQLNRIAGANLGAKLKEKVNLKRFFGESGKDGIKSLTDRAKKLFASGEDFFSESVRNFKDESVDEAEQHKTRKGNNSPDGVCPRVEYWIYSPESEIPKWEDVKRSFGKAISSMPARARAFKLLESLIASNDLNIEYMLRSDAEELFDYPEELVKLNSKDLTENDLDLLRNSQMIVRMELAPTSSWGTESLKFIISFVEGLRDLTNGIVQDAISHTLWGLDCWLEFTRRPFQEGLADHLHLDVLDENGTIWMHTHGMLKFGLPDLELEGVPANFRKQGQELLVMAATELIAKKGISKRLGGELSVFDGAILVDYEFRHADDEGHFPDGVFSLRPFIRGEKPGLPEALSESLKLMEAGSVVQDTVPVSHENSRHKSRWANPGQKVDEARSRILDAHKKARDKLEDFRKSFQDYSSDESHVHAVKVGFPVKDGKYEWMWMSLADWNNGTLLGLLENTPVVRTDLYKGCTVKINESEIFDWVISSDGKILNGAFTEGVRK